MFISLSSLVSIEVKSELGGFKQILKKDLGIFLQGELK